MPFAPQWLSLIQPVHVLSAAFVERPIVHNSTASMPTMLRALFMFASSSSGFTGRKPGIMLGWRLALLPFEYAVCRSIGWKFAKKPMPLRLGPPNLILQAGRGNKKLIPRRALAAAASARAGTSPAYEAAPTRTFGPVG